MDDGGGDAESAVAAFEGAEVEGAPGVASAACTSREEHLPLPVRWLVVLAPLPLDLLLQ